MSKNVLIMQLENYELQYIILKQIYNIILSQKLNENIQKILSTCFDKYSLDCQSEKRCYHVVYLIMEKLLQYQKKYNYELFYRSGKIERIENFYPSIRIVLQHDQRLNLFSMFQPFIYHIPEYIRGRLNILNVHFLPQSSNHVITVNNIF